MDPLHRSQSRESAQSAKSTKLSSPYALSSASSGSTSSRKGRSADPETTVADVSSTRQPSQRPPAAGALSDFNTRTVSEAALPSSERPNPTPVASTAGVFAGDFTHEAVEAGSSEGSVADSEPDAQTNSQVHGTTTAESSISVTTSSQYGGSLATSPQNLFARDSIPTSPPGSAPSSSFHASASNSSLHWANGVRQSSQHQPVARSRSRTRTSRRISGVNVNTHSSSPGSESTRSTLPREEKRKAPLGVIGVCALDTKARSKPSRNILSKLIQNKEFDVIIFGDKVILDEEVENWPECDYLISFFSDGFPLDKAIAYDKLRKPFCVNDLPMQTVLWDRRLCLKILDKLNVPTPKRIEVNRDGGPVLPNSEMAQILYEKTGISLPGPENGTGGGMQAPKSIAMLEDDDILCVDGEKLKKPFVEKPVSGEDHNIRIYYPTSMGGGGRRLFRKVNNKSSEKDDSLKVPRCMTEPQTSYIYEQFVNVEKAEDIKAYTVGPNFCHAETRKSPVVDGLVKRNPNGKELRYVCSLTEEEKEMATKVVNAFGQRVCGFDLLRADGKSYVIDVNGWSFVKDNNEYYDQAAKILKELFVNEKLRKEGKLREPQEPESKAGADPGTIQRKGPGGHRATLKGLFHSPSLAKLGGGHHQSHSNRPGSPEIGTSTLPMSSPPSMEHPLGVLGKPIAASQPQLPPPAMSEQGDSVESRHSATPSVPEKSPVPPPASKAQWKLKGMVSVIRHADRTPKQKFKFTFHTKPFVDLLKGHQEEVLLIGEAALDSVIEAVHTAMKEGIEDLDKLRLLRSSLLKKGAWIGTKVQIKPMFREKKKAELAATEKQPPEGAQSMEEARADNSPAGKIKDAPGGCEARHESSPDVTLSRISAKEKDLVLDKLQLIVKWGGEPTHSARYQAKDLGDNLRADLMIMNRECVEDVTIYSSSERRVTTSAQIFASAFLAKEDLSANFITVRKDLLDDSNAAKDEMDKVKKKLKQLLREGDKAPSQFAWPDDTPEPFIVVRTVVELMKFHRNVMHQNFKKLQSGAASSLAAVINPASVDGSSQTTSTSSSSLSQANAVANIQPRWCCSEDAELFRERWEKLFKEFCDAEKVDPSKISELYDTMKFDALHNRQFLEWVFTPDASMLDEESVADSTATSPLIPGSSVQSSRRTSRSGMAESLSMPPPADKPEKQPVSSRIGFRRHSQHDRANSLPKSKTTSQIETTEPFTDSYFNLYKGNSGSGQSKAKFDARLAKLRELYKLCKVLFDYIGPQEYGISPAEKLEIGLLTSLPLLKEIVADLEEVQAYEGAKSFWYFTKESHIYTLLNCILEGGVKTKIERKKIPELDYLAQINFELYESQNETSEGAEESFNYSIRITISPGCHTFDPLDVQLDSKHCIGCAPRRSLTDHGDWKEILETLREKFTKVNLPKTFTAINLSEKGVFRDRAGKDEESLDTADV
ncbi:hypothetical protein FKW77_003103 [Venturia effusa]|uniref:Inositol hexakisphosphate and diphosphoinositol-pentakisphosphate kinase n=1 Tax=Venturia effusa TaxID=50376 RepID=A0A517LID6_9PEZI|nr:hypothetical protein FKW77_003103 [Venturia effusa]